MDPKEKLFGKRVAVVDLLKHFGTSSLVALALVIAFLGSLKELVVGYWTLIALTTVITGFTTCVITTAWALVLHVRYLTHDSLDAETRKHINWQTWLSVIGFLVGAVGLMAFAFCVLWSIKVSLD